MTDVVAHAKQILRDAGYVVIPRERHVILTVDKEVSSDLLAMLKHESQLSAFQASCERSVGEQMGIEMMLKGAITKDNLGRDGHPYARERWRYQAGVILPK